MTGIQYNKKSLSKNTSELNIEYDGENFVILNSKENVEKLYNILASLEARTHAAESEIKILRNQPSITAAHQASLVAARDAINNVLGEEIVIDYDKNILDAPIFSFQEFFIRFGYVDKNIKVRPIDLKNQYYEYCEDHGYEAEKLSYALPIAFLKDHFGAQKIRDLVNPNTSNYIYHIGIDLSNNDTIETKVVNDDEKVINSIIINDDLNIVTAEEYWMYCKQNDIPIVDFKKSIPQRWLKEVANNVYGLSGMCYTFGKLPTKLTQRFVKTKFIKGKIILDEKGGIEFLYRMFKVGKSPIDFAKDFFDCKTPASCAAMITKYLKLYGFNGWQDFCEFIMSCNYWEEAKHNIIQKRDSYYYGLRKL